jgi:cation diffusion facilitator family transporter
VNQFRVASLSVLVGICVFALKWYAYWLTDSIALYSDALESVVNIVAATVAFIALWISHRPVDHNHPYGHTKAEYFSAGFEGALIVVAALVIIYEAGGRLLTPTPLASVGIGVFVSLAASGLNTLLAIHLIYTGKSHQSPALKADGLHILSDVITSVGVLIGIGLAWLTGWWILDPLMAFLVALNILWMGGRLLNESISGLMDEGMTAEELSLLNKIIAANMQGALQVHQLKTRRAGSITFIEFHLVVPAEMTVKVAHDICNRLEGVLQQTLPRTEIVIHIEPESEVEQQRVISPTMATEL